MFKNYRLRDFDFKLVLMVLALAGIGVMTIGSAEPSLQTRQLAERGDHLPKPRSRAAAP